MVAMIGTVSACECQVNVNNNVSVTSILTQIQWMTQQQSQQQQQTVNVAAGTTNSWIGNTYGSGDSGSGGNGNVGGIVQNSNTYSRLMYPGEVLVFPVVNGSTCTLLAGLPVGFYMVGSGHGYNENMVQTITAIPTYDPVYHRMEFGQVPVKNKVDYWTMKAKLVAGDGDDFCVVDNRAPMNSYTTIEVTY